MLTLLFTLCALFSIAAKAQSDCNNKYVVVNSFEDIDKIEVSCYNEAAPCDLYYSAPGQNTAQVYLGAVNASGYEVIVADIAYGGRLYSNHQIGVSYGKSSGSYYFVTLPRAPDAGTRFAVPLPFHSSQFQSYYLEWSISAIVKSATVSYQTNLDGQVEVFDVQANETVLRKIYMDSTQNLTVRFTSDQPIIITSYDRDHEIFRTWEPTTKFPVFALVDTNYMTLALSNCQTNEEITDFSLVDIDYVDLPDGTPCRTYKSSDSLTADDSIVGGKCMIFVASKAPQVCVSVSLQYNPARGTFEGMGIPLSKRVYNVNNFSTSARFVTTFSFQQDNCQLFDTSDNRELPYSHITNGSSLVPLDIQHYISEDLGKFGKLKCEQPAFVYELGHTEVPIYNLGSQADNLWDQYFDDIGCPF